MFSIPELPARYRVLHLKFHVPMFGHCHCWLFWLFMLFQVSTLATWLPWLLPAAVVVYQVEAFSSQLLIVNAVVVWSVTMVTDCCNCLISTR